MENTLFGSNRTKLTGRTNDFNLDTGLYKAMYEQSQMELKILEAMIKADNLSRKYRAQGIYTEAAIQAFNEEAKTKLWDTIKQKGRLFIEKLKEWWKTLKGKIISALAKFREWLKSHNPFKKKANAAVADQTNGNNGNADNAGGTKKSSSASASDVAKAIKRGKAIPMGSGVNPKLKEISVEWVDIDKVDNAMNEIQDFIADMSFSEIFQLHLDAQTGSADDYDDNINKAIDEANKKLKEMEDDTQKASHKIKLENIPCNSFEEAQKMTIELQQKTADVDKLINNADAKFNGFTAKAGEIDSACMSFFSTMQSLTMKYFNTIGKMIKDACQKNISAIMEKGKYFSYGSYGEMANLVFEAGMYEIFMAPTSVYDLYSAEGIKRFAAAKLEAAMGEINDVIDQAIGSNNAQGIENVNLAGTDVLGAGVSNDPNRLVYDDDCYSQGGTFGDENIAGYVDANIAGTSTSVARGNETKAAMEGFLFNW